MQSLKWSVISFTEKGAELAEKIKRLSKEQQLPSEIHTYHGRKQVENLNAWTKEQFSLRNAIIFIGACGIAVRTIAPFLKDKLTDSPVLVLDEAGNYVIPLLSGHVGGANEIALLLAELLGAVPVITTATDINNAFAIDVFAKKHDLLEVMPALCNPDFEAMELIHARLVRKTTCSNGCKCDYTICGDRDEFLNAHPEYRDEAGYRRNR